MLSINILYLVVLSIVIQKKYIIFVTFFASFSLELLGTQSSWFALYTLPIKSSGKRWARGVVFVDVKHHVYLLTGLVTYFMLTLFASHTNSVLIMAPLIQIAGHKMAPTVVFYLRLSNFDYIYNWTRMLSVLCLEWMCDECTWHHKTFLVQLYWHLAIKLYCIVLLYCRNCSVLGSVSIDRAHEAPFFPFRFSRILQRREFLHGTAELSSCVKVEVAVLGSPSLIVRTGL